ncbi:MAG: hypothetical protein HZB75_01795 [Candidatus Saccharibacteria bacterium]|nr:MAG: hypothetical protein HZB75_01795 [Candidatus Saccharibacteria bacterium]
MKYLVFAALALGLAAALVQAAKYFVGYFMPQTADKVDAWREQRFISKTAQAILDGNDYIGWELQRYVERRTPKLLPRPEHENTYGTMQGHPEAAEFDQIAAANRHARIIDVINVRTKEGFDLRRNAA